MNKTDIKSYLKLYSHKILDDLGLGDQNIVYEYLKDSEDRAETITSFPYKDIIIKITPKNIDTNEELLQVLLHEYAHVILAPFTHYNEKVNLKLSKRQATALDEHMGLMEEIVATHLERVFVKLGV